LIHSLGISTTGRVCANDEPVKHVEIIIHITDILDSVTRSGLQAVILKNTGVFSAEFCTLRYHLLLVQYDSNKINSRDVLAIVVAQNHTAQIVAQV
jgi:hypothetical protein